jgi:S-(hydroxymethyl)glutathione dehydrogenase/alcohol dehydrogenase
MKAAVLREVRRPLEVMDVSIDKPKSREVLVRVIACGLCHSDYHFMNGDLPVALPAILGHEVSGIVEAIGDQVTSCAVGDRITGNPALFCGHCEYCVSGKNHICSEKPVRGLTEASRIALDGHKVSASAFLGGFAEMMLVHENSVVKMPTGMPMDKAALLGCGVITGVGAVINAARVRPGSKVAVLGCGGVGLNAIQAARLVGAAQIIAIDLVPEKLEMAREMGATHFVGKSDDTVAEVRELSKGGVDYSFEVVGLPKTMAMAVEMLRPGGLMTIVGVSPVNAEIPINGFNMLKNEWRIQGTYLGSSPGTREIPMLANLFLKGQLQLMLAERIALEDINAGFDRLVAGKQARSVITFPDVLAEAQRQDG